MTAIQEHRSVVSASFALLLVAVQFATIRYATSDGLVRIVLPATVAAVPLALWTYRTKLGVWVMYIGLMANLTAMLANGGLMPIERSSVVAAIGAERAARYETGDWISGSKDVLVASGGGQLTALGDSIVLRVGSGGMVASPGDIVIWCGLLILAAEASLAWQRRARPQETVAAHAESVAEGGAAA